MPFWLSTDVGLRPFGIYLSPSGSYWVQPSSVKDVVVAWGRRMKNSGVSCVWKIIPLAIWWCTWKERNHWIFED